MFDSFKRLLRALGIGASENGAASEGEASPGPADSAPIRRGGDVDGPLDGSEREASVDMLSCPEALDRLFEYLDGELESPMTSRVRAHLEKCRRCYPRLQFEKAFMETLRRARAGEEPPRNLRRRVVDVLREEGLELH